MNKKTVTVAAIQCQINPDKEKNTRQLAEKIKAAARAGAELVMLPELHNTEYFCQIEDPKHFALAESIPGETTDYLAALARQLHIVLVGSVFERRAAGIYHNTVVVLDRNGELAGCYRKMHIPEDPGYYEKYYFTPGDLGFHPIETSVAKLGILVCWDQWFPEAARLMALAGADLLLYPSAIGWAQTEDLKTREDDFFAWQLMQRSHAIANGLPVISCNRCGFEAADATNRSGIEFWGGSFIAGTRGELLAESDRSEQIVMAAIDLSTIENTRQCWPYLRDRRIDAYQNLLERWSS